MFWSWALSSSRVSLAQIHFGGRPVGLSVCLGDFLVDSKRAFGEAGWLGGRAYGGIGADF